MTIFAGLVLFLTLGLLLVFGVPVGLAVLVSAIITMLLILPFDMTMFTTAQQLAVGVDNFTILAIPLFILAGIIMNNGGIAFRLINFAKVLVGRIPGSLAHTNVVGNMLFGSISGSSVASAAAIGRVMIPMQVNQKYSRNYGAATNIASAPVGLLLPPSPLLIVYSLVSGGTSIAALFIAGYIPGILWGLGVIIMAYFIAKRRQYPVSETISWKDKGYIILSALPSLLLIVIVMGGIIAGFFTATEAAAVAVLYATILTVLYKSLTLKDIPEILRETISITGMILFLITASAMFSFVMSYTGIPEGISSSLLSITDNMIILLLLINLILLVIGTFMDITPAVLIFTPILFPIAMDLGIDPVHFGIIVTFNLCIGNITPPIGTVLFVGTRVANARFEGVIKALVPYFIMLVVILLVITFVPQLSLYLPELFDL
ncbi:TRAP transporter large permease [Salicibibacter halophilus]|uniref:TRAP transporter large permease n=1 Tax=Salicibibacter halophilus TaxID=2502791 RepID=A0A514LLY2_9BACI|nr:TRAP transporter large permease [Salicibibacter halophilus]QDI92879.1 TRAP transporter large permease [Salicibibacter halophilus]